MAQTSKSSASSGMSSGIITYLQEQGQAHGNTHSAGAVGGGGEGFDHRIGGGEHALMHITNAKFDLSFGHVTLPGMEGEGVFSRNPIKDIADGNFFTPGNINAMSEFAKGLQSSVGDLQLANATGPRAANISPGLGANSLAAGQGTGGQGH